MKFLPKINLKLSKSRSTDTMGVIRVIPIKSSNISNNNNGFFSKANSGYNKRKVTPLSAENAANVLKEHIASDSTEAYLDEFGISKPKFFTKATNKDFVKTGTFHEAVGKIFLMAEFFAIMPVVGVTAAHPKDLSFSWKNLRVAYCIVFISVGLFDLSIALYKVLNGPITFNNIEPLIFRFCILFVSISSINLARKWPELMMLWHEVESDLPQYTNKLEKGRMAFRIKIVTFVDLMISVGEHLLSLLSAVQLANYCHYTDDPIVNFFTAINTHLFPLFPFSFWLAWLGKIINVISTFIWNYMDIFVMIVSIGLASKFKQLNDNLFKIKGMQMPVEFWSERRIQYRNLCVLTEEMDKAISLITMASFSNNLYFICVQLLKSLNTMPSFAHAVYFYFSLSFLLGRTLAVSLYSSSVHDESRKALRILRCVPKESWCPEIKRFSEEISNDLVALSGMKFFHLTRKLILSVAGTIVTYELVLIQFREDSDVWICPGMNNTN